MACMRIFGAYSCAMLRQCSPDRHAWNEVCISHPYAAIKILTWHTHGSYLYYLSHAPHDFYIVSRPDRRPGYGGRCGNLRWGDNVHDQPADALRGQRFDCVLYQDDHQYLYDRHQLLDDWQQRLPAIYLEHDPPREHPTDTRHPVNDPNMMLVHVTAFNALMWDNGRTPVSIIEHGVPCPEQVWTGETARGISVINHLATRGRRLGADIFLQARQTVPLDLLGMGSEAIDGLGELPLHEIPALCARYRFFFHPVRYTSLGLAAIEAMMMGMPVVALATTEIPTLIDNGIHGFVDTSPERLINGMQHLLKDHGLARQMGEKAHSQAQQRFGIERFISDWNRLLSVVTS